MFSVNQVSKFFSGKPVLRGVSFAVPLKSRVGVVGPSGSGKSVLLKIIGGVLSPDYGSVVTGEQSDTLPNEVGFLFQEGALFDSMSVLDNVCFPIVEGPKRSSLANARQMAQTALSRVGLSEAILKFPGQLSGGMRRRVALARALVSEPELLLLDDPTGGLDPVAAGVIMKLIESFHTTVSSTIFVVSHDIRRLMPFCDRIIAVFDGQIVCNCERDNLLEAAPPEVINFLKTRYNFANPRT